MTTDPAPGFTVLCILGDYSLIQSAARCVGRAGRAIACSSYPGRFAWPSNSGEMAVHTCVCRLHALPFLSHSIDVVMGPAGTMWTEGFTAEVRRVLAPGGLVVAYLGHTEVQTLALCRERSVEAGLELVDDEAFARRLGVAGTLITARAPRRRHR